LSNLIPGLDRKSVGKKEDTFGHSDIARKRCKPAHNRKKAGEQSKHVKGTLILKLIPIENERFYGNGKYLTGN